jgi:citrate lyase subunit beta/citryl-CoA lyase
MPAPGDDPQEAGRLTMRSLLFVPGDSERKLAKALSSGADVVIVDLEDSVAAENKAAARAVASAFLGSVPRQGAPRLYVRVNELGSGLLKVDLAAVMAARPDGVMLPKCNAGVDVVELAAMLRVAEAAHGIADGATAIIPLITETPAGVLAAASYGNPHPRLAGLTWGAEDLSAAIGASATRDSHGRYTDVFRIARALTILAASAAGVAAIDTVFVNFRDASGLRKECQEAARDGFTGKLAIHPDQVPIINVGFTPSVQAIEEATAIIKAFADAGMAGVVSIDGKMYDRPHLRRAERLLARAGAAGPKRG